MPSSQEKCPFSEYERFCHASRGCRTRKITAHRINPFRLIGVFPNDWRGLLNGAGTLKTTGSEESSLEITAMVLRDSMSRPLARARQNFQRALRQYSVGRLDWLRRLHRSHAPQAGPFSACMHRTDAATVSYRVAVSSRRATMRYRAGTPPDARTPPGASSGGLLRADQTAIGRKQRWTCGNSVVSGNYGMRAGFWGVGAGSGRTENWCFSNPLLPTTTPPPEANSLITNERQ